MSDRRMQIERLRERVLADGGDWTTSKATIVFPAGQRPTATRCRQLLNQLADEGLLVKHGKIGRLWTQPEELPRDQATSDLRDQIIRRVRTMLITRYSPDQIADAIADLVHPTTEPQVSGPRELGESDLRDQIATAIEDHGLNLDSHEDVLELADYINTTAFQPELDQRDTEIAELRVELHRMTLARNGADAMRGVGLRRIEIWKGRAERYRTAWASARIGRAQAREDRDQALINEETAKGWRDQALAERDQQRAYLTDLRATTKTIESQRDQLTLAIERVRAAVATARERDANYLRKRDKAQQRFRTQWDNRAHEIRRLAQEIETALDPPEEMAGVTCPARTGPIPKLGGEACSCVLREGHETEPLDQSANGDVEGRDHRCSCGSWWVDSIRRDQPDQETSQ